jgi:hypothetical protein
MVYWFGLLKKSVKLPLGWFEPEGAAELSPEGTAEFVLACSG